jgi:hypothetical protein
MAQFMFGVGRLTLMPVGGGAPTSFGALQNISVDFAGDIKELWGRNQFPLDVARGKVKITGKASAAQVDANLYNSAFFGQTVTTGQTLVADSESHAIPTTPFQVTATNSATFLYTIALVNAANGNPFVQVASGPTAGQYSVNNATGVYTFASADNVSGISVLITYAYSATTGNTLTINNQLMGATPTFQLVANGLYKTKQITLTLLSCVSSKLTMPLKLDDHMIPEFDFSAYDNGSGAIGTLTDTNT